MALEKMLILGFTDSQQVETGGRKEAADFFEALINPESYTHDYKLKFSEHGQAPGTSGKQLKYEYTEPEEITFEFLLDNTGIIDGRPCKNISEDLKKLKQVLIEYKGDSHEPRHFKMLWGENSVFKGRVTELGITYKLFNPDGSPIRAVVKVKFKSSIEDLILAAKEDRRSPDLTHIRQVKAGDTLPLLCHRIYGDSRYYMQVATHNHLGDFRRLVPGTQLEFPPLASGSKLGVTTISTS